MAAPALVESMVRIPARGLTNLAFPPQVARRELARVPARDTRVVLLSDCVHNAGPDPRPFAARLPRLDVLRRSHVMSAVIVVATAYPAPEHKAEVIAAFEAAIATVHSEEPGCELYALHEGNDRLVMIEKYASQDAMDQHIKGAGLAGLRAALEGKLGAPLDVQVLTPHPAGSEDKGAL